MARVLGCPVFVCGSTCKIDLCLDMCGPYNCWTNYSVQKKFPNPPDPRFQIFSQFPDSRFFGLQFPDSRFYEPLFPPDSRCWFTPPDNISQDTHYPFCNGICMVKSSKQDNSAEILNGICMVGVQNKTIQQRFQIISDRNCCTLW